MIWMCKHYIGQTGDTLRHRLTVKQIRAAKYPCATVYYTNTSKNVPKNIFMNFTVCPNIKFYKTNAEKERDTKEKHLISLYKPELNE